MPKIFTLILINFFLLYATATLAQNNFIEVRGKVVDGNMGQAMEFVTVFIADPSTQQLLTGTTTDENGFFNLESSTEDFYIELSFIGFSTKRITEFTIANNQVNLETITLETNNQTLDEVEVRAEKSQTVFKLDKRVFNVGKDLSSTGASALEVLNNVPSVIVNIEGQISLRGSTGVQVLLNGKPSVISNEGSNALGTITADMIERVEVITNPSAKYDAAGTSGIINIVLKKEEKQGLNGSVTLNTGSPNSHSLGLSLNRRTEKLNLFSQFGIGYRTLPRMDEKITDDFLANTRLSRMGNIAKNEAFINLILGADYHISKNEVFTLAGTFALEKENEDSSSDFQFLEQNSLSQSWTRTEDTRATNPKYEFEAQYKKYFKNHEERDLIISASGRFFGKDQSSTFGDQTTFGSRENFSQESSTDFQNISSLFKIDYTHPFAEKYMIEAGAQYIYESASNDYEVRNFEDNIFVIDTALTNVFDGTQTVLGLYSTVAYEGDKWGVKAGLRVEEANLSALLQSVREENKNTYRNLFPSFHTSYNLTENLSFQASYSRRIQLPSLWDLNPFFNIRDNFNISLGNPNLQPEFTNSYEFSGIFKAEKVSLNFAIYHRFTEGVIEEISSFQDNVTTWLPINLGTDKTTGLEYNMKYTPNKWMTLNLDFNYSFFQREGQYENTSFDFDGQRWSSRLTTKFKLPAQMDLEISGQYRSKFQTVQGERLDNAFANIGLRKKIIKGKIILNLSVRDIFASRRWEFITSQDDFYLYTKGYQGRFIVFGLSHGFGKGEAMEFSGHKRF